MTRVLPVCSLAFLAFAPAALFGQVNSGPSAPSRYAQPAAGVAQQQGQVYGPQPAGVPQQRTGQIAQPANPYPVRVAGGQQPITPPPVATGPAAPPPGLAMPATPQPPEWVAALTPRELQWIDQVLTYWEDRSNKVGTFECKFNRWDYEPIFGPKDEKGNPLPKAKTIAQGSIKYAQPDKGAYQVEKLSLYVAPTMPGEEGKYIEQDATMGEHWICDGKVIYSHEPLQKTLRVVPLPPQMQGQAIADGPLPFMFGAKAATIQARYWIHEMPADVKETLPNKGDGKYCLEAFPKARQDAQNFSKIRIILDGKEFLPEVLEVFAPNYTPQNPVRQTYQFLDRQTTDKASILAAIAKGFNPMGIFQRNFYEPKTPAGWKKVVENPPVAAGPAAPANAATRPNAAPQPGAPVTR